MYGNKFKFNIFRLQSLPLMCVPARTLLQSKCLSIYTLYNLDQQSLYLYL